MPLTTGTSWLVALVLVSAEANGAPQPKATPVHHRLEATMGCPRPDPAALSATPVRCVYTAGEIAGETLQHEDDLFASDMYRSTSESVAAALRAGGDPGQIARLGRGRDRHNGTGVIRLANGDTVKVRFRGLTLFRGDAPEKGQGTWQFFGGTGKAEGIAGKGTYTGTFFDDGSASWELTGRYSVIERQP